MIDQAPTDEAPIDEAAVPTDVDESVPVPDQRTGPIARYDERHKVLWIGSMPVPFRVGENRNGELLDLLSMTIRQLRGLGQGEPCPLRRTEHELLGSLLDLDDPELRLDLRRYLGLNRRQAGDTVMQLRRVLRDDAIKLS